MPAYAWDEYVTCSGFHPDVLHERHPAALPERDGLWDADNCPQCSAALMDGVCFKCDHGCPSCGGRLDREFACAVCGRAAFRCPGDTCRVCHPAGNVAA